MSEFNLAIKVAQAATISDDDFKAQSARFLALRNEELGIEPAVKASPGRPDIKGAFWSDKIDAYVPYVWGGFDLATLAAKAAGDESVTISDNPQRQFKGLPGCVATHSGGAWGNGQPLEVRFGGKFVKGFVKIVAGLTMFNPTEDGAPNNAQVLLQPGMTYRVPAGMAE